MTKLMLVMIELIILVKLKVHANDPTTPSSAPTTLPIGLHLFQLDNAKRNNIEKLCIEDTFKKCTLEEPFCTAKHLLECLFQSPMHPNDFSIKLLGYITLECFELCYTNLGRHGFRYARCLINCYKRETKKHNIKN
jgi:hypothetical protein